MYTDLLVKDIKTIVDTYIHYVHCELPLPVKDKVCDFCRIYSQYEKVIIKDIDHLQFARLCNRHTIMLRCIRRYRKFIKTPISETACIHYADGRLCICCNCEYIEQGSTYYNRMLICKKCYYLRFNIHRVRNIDNSYVFADLNIVDRVILSLDYYTYPLLRNKVTFLIAFSLTFFILGYIYEDLRRMYMYNKIPRIYLIFLNMLYLKSTPYFIIFVLIFCNIMICQEILSEHIEKLKLKYI